MCPPSCRTQQVGSHSGRDDGQRGARHVSLGHQSNRNAPSTGGTRCHYCAYLSIDFLSTICPIDRPKVFLVRLHVLRNLLGNTIAYSVVRIWLLFNRPKKDWRSVSLSYCTRTTICLRTEFEASGSALLRAGGCRT